MVAPNQGYLGQICKYNLEAGNGVVLFSVQKDNLFLLLSQKNHFCFIEVNHKFDGSQ